MEIYAISCDFMGFHGILWDFMGFHGISWDLTDFYCFYFCFFGKT